MRKTKRGRWGEGVEGHMNAARSGYRILVGKHVREVTTWKRRK
jgi:hypothetical protein